MRNIVHELRHALGRLGRSPGFTAAAALSLALAIGANVTIFTVVDRVVLNPLPYPDSGRLIDLNFAMPSRNIAAFNSMTSRQYFHYTDHARTLSGLTVYRTEDRTITGRGIPERVRIARTTPSLASVFRVNPAIGRWFTDAEGVPGSQAAVAVLSNGLWERRYGARLDAVGQPITIDGIPSTIIGVMPASFSFPDQEVDVWLLEPWSAATGADAYSYSGVARLQDGATIEGARAELTTLSVALEATAPRNGYRVLVNASRTLHEATIGQISTTLWVLLASAGIVLLVACANIANLFLVRSEARQREIGVRRALGAGTGNVAAYFLAESAILSSAGGALGLAAAWGGVQLLVAYGPTTLPRLHEIHVTSGSLAFTVALCALSALAFGAVPLLRLRSSSASLQHSERSATAGRTGDWTRRLLMAGQVALALVLLVGAGLLLRSFQRLSAVDHGFDPTSTLTFQVGLPPSNYPERQKVVATHQAVLDAIARLPGVTSASMTNCVPLSGRGFCGGAPLFVEGDPAVPPGNRPIVAIRPVAGSFFETMRIPIRRGRGITRRDVENNELVAVVNEAFVRGLPNRDPIGMRVRLGPHAQPSVDLWFTIVGVVPTTPTFALGESISAPKMYTPMFAGREVWPAVNVMTYVVRTTTPPTDLTQPIRAAMADVDGNLALSQVRTLQSLLDAAGSQRAFTLVLLLVASGTALLLGLVGIYSVTSYLVSQRTAEIGVRLALGAEPGRVMRMVVRQGATVAAGGIAIGLLAAFVSSPAISPLLYGVNPRDPAVFATVALTLMIVALVACWLPARRAASVDPLVALRSD